MPKKRKTSLGRKTAGAKKVNQIRLNEDDQTYSQRLDVDKERKFIERKTETSEHKDWLKGELTDWRNMKYICLLYNLIIIRSRFSVNRHLEF